MGRLAIIGGQCSKVGKTALVIDLMRALSDVEWTAAKITPHAEAGCPVNGLGCRCGLDEHTFAIREESSAGGKTDTSRFLAAGARRALWLEAKENRLGDALTALSAALWDAGHVVIESTEIARFWRPHLFLMVVDPRQADFKKSARDALAWVDAFVLRSPYFDTELPDWAKRAIDEKQKFVQSLGAPVPCDMQTLARQLIGGSRHPT